MPRKAQPAKPKRPTLKMPRAEAERRLRVQVEKGRKILRVPLSNEADLTRSVAEEDKWSDYNYELLKRVVDTDDLANDYYPSAYIIPSETPPFYRRVADFQETVGERIKYLESVIERLDLIPEGVKAKQSTGKTVRQKAKSDKRVFIVHGHDEEAKLFVARFIEKLGFPAVILHEQPNRGKTIIEKFEEHAANISFAVVLLTPDDVGARKDESSTLRPRARQNVILELGFFAAKLGRERVCALHKGDVELPSDFEGVLWHPMDANGAWRIDLGREMRAAGLNVDLNKLMW